MNKAKAYRELQRRQGRLGKMWSEVSSVTQSYDSSIRHPFSRTRDGNTATNSSEGNTKENRNSNITAGDKGIIKGKVNATNVNVKQTQNYMVDTSAVKVRLMGYR